MVDVGLAEGDIESDGLAVEEAVGLEDEPVVPLPVVDAGAGAVVPVVGVPEADGTDEVDVEAAELDALADGLANVPGSSASMIALICCW